MKKLKQIKTKKQNKKKFGIAFGGGGTRGFGHIGVIKAFEEEGICFDQITGTSAGSLVGALYAYGLTSSEMIEIAKTMRKKDIIKNFLPINNKTDGIQNLVKSAIGDIHFDELKVPLTLISTDLNTGKEIRISTGSVAKAVAGSCAFPGIFAPLEYGKYRLIDGGTRNNIPADVLKNSGCDVIISVDVNSTRGSGTTSTKFKDVFLSSLFISMKNNSLNGRLYSNMVIEPDLEKFSPQSLDGYMEMIDEGYKLTKQLMPQIKQVLCMEKTPGFWSKLFRRNKQKILQENDKDSIKI